jgi:uncharacterized membrane protein
MDTADKVLEELKKLQKESLITLEDAAVVIRSADGKAKVKQAQNLVGAGALGGSFWGLLIGALFWMPWLGLAMGALSGALSGKLTDIGIDDKFIKEVSESIEPGNSAIFMLIWKATEDKVIERLKPFGGKIIHTNLSQAQEDAITEAFGQS